MYIIIMGFFFYRKLLVVVFPDTNQLTRQLPSFYKINNVNAVI